MTMNATSLIKYVDHTYRDFSCFTDEGGKLIKHKKSGNNFPARLHRLLTETDPDIITWMPHGRAWKVIDKTRLIREVIPKYYVCKKYESFTRQLNGWGFKRLHQTGPDFGCYYHECFLRDLPKLTCMIRRLPAKLGKSAPFAEGEPNFYRISELYPLPPPPPHLRNPQDAASRPHAATSNDLSIPQPPPEQQLPQSHSGSLMVKTDDQTPKNQHLNSSGQNIASNPGVAGDMAYPPNYNQASSYYHHMPPPPASRYSQAPPPPAYMASYSPAFHGSSSQYHGNSYGQYPPTSTQPYHHYYPPVQSTNRPPNEAHFSTGGFAQGSEIDYNYSAYAPNHMNPCLAVSSSSATSCISHLENGSCRHAATQQHQEQQDQPSLEPEEDPFEPIHLS